MTILLFFQASWPQNGLDLAMVGLPSLWTWMGSVVSSTTVFVSFTIVSILRDHWVFLFIFNNTFSKDDNDDANELENLKSLVSSLRMLLDLHQKYSCRLSLSVFEKVCLLLVTALLYTIVVCNVVYMKLDMIKLCEMTQPKSWINGFVSMT